MRRKRGQAVEARASVPGVGRRRKISRISSTKCGVGVDKAGGRRRGGRKGDRWLGLWTEWARVGEVTRGCALRSDEWSGRVRVCRTRNLVSSKPDNVSTKTKPDWMARDKNFQCNKSLWTLLSIRTHKNNQKFSKTFFLNLKTICDEHIQIFYICAKFVVKWNLWCYVKKTNQETKWDLKCIFLEHWFFFSHIVVHVSFPQEITLGTLVYVLTSCFQKLQSNTHAISSRNLACTWNTCVCTY